MCSDKAWDLVGQIFKELRDMGSQYLQVLVKTSSESETNHHRDDDDNYDSDDEFSHPLGLYSILYFTYLFPFCCFLD